MKCLVCHKEFEGNLCPRCGFPVVESTDVDALLESMGAQIEEYRRDFENGIKLELVIYRWKEAEGSVVLDRKEDLPLGSYQALRGKETWLPHQFARIPDLDALELTVAVNSGETRQEVPVRVPNLKEPALQSAGIEVDGEMNFRLKLRNDRGGQSASAWTPIL